MSFMADISKLPSFPFVRTCKIDSLEGTENLAMIRLLIREMSRKKERGAKNNPPVSRGSKKTALEFPRWELSIAASHSSLRLLTSSEVRQGVRYAPPPPSNGRWLETPAPHGLTQDAVSFRLIFDLFFAPSAHSLFKLKAASPPLGWPSTKFTSLILYKSVSVLVAKNLRQDQVKLRWQLTWP